MSLTVTRLTKLRKELILVKMEKRRVGKEDIFRAKKEKIALSRSLGPKAISAPLKNLK